MTQKNVCFVTTDFAGVIRNGGIGTHYWLMSHLLAEAGWGVHVLFCGPCDDEERLRAAPAVLAPHGITFTALADLPAPPGASVQRYGGDAATLILSELLVDALDALHREHSFDLIEFSDWGALAVRPIQSKVSGDVLTDARLAVKLHSTTQWQREGNLNLRPTPRDLKMEFCERYAFEHADCQLSPSRYMLDYTRALDWTVREDAAIAYPYPHPEPEPTAQVTDVAELVFFGRLEPRKGLHLFLDALDVVDRQIPALFLGKDTLIGAQHAVDVIAERLGDRPFRIETELDREGALAELRSGDRLAVIASRSETFGFTVAECVTNRIPFIAAAAGGIPEVVDHAEGRRRWLFEPTTDGLREALKRRLAAPGEAEVELRAEVAEACDAGRWNERVESVYREAASRPLRRSAGAAPATDEPATVTVAVSHYNHPQFLPSALASLAAQTRPPDEVLVVDDGSTSEEARRVFAEQAALYPQWSFSEQPNSGPGAVRNNCLERTRSSYFLPFDSDNVAAPDLIERLLQAMKLNPERAATTCHNLAFVEDQEIESGDFAFRYSPTGGPLIYSLLENVYGDTCALFRTAALRSVGGFEERRWSPHEDWETFVKMAVRGLQLGVLPRPLFYYRTDVGGRLQELTADPAMTFAQRALMIDEFLADAELAPRDRRDLWECLLAFDYLAFHGVAEQTSELRKWHDSEMEKLAAWGEEQMEGLRAHLVSIIESEHARAEIALRQLDELRSWHDQEMEQLRTWEESRRGELADRLRQVGIHVEDAPPSPAPAPQGAEQMRRVLRFARRKAGGARRRLRRIGGLAALRGEGALSRLAAEAGSRLLDSRGLKLEQTPQALLRRPELELKIDLDYVLAQHAASTSDFYFVQIGAFDGRTADPLAAWVHAQRWRGMLVEPQPRYFAELVENYRDLDGLEFRQVAVGPKEEMRALYTVADEPGVPHWAGLLASFDRETLLSHREYLPRIDELLRTEDVRCVALNDLLAEAPTDQIDLVQIDVEGYDHELIRVLDFARFAPTIIRFEHVHLTPEQHDACVERLLTFGYRVAIESEDTLGYKTSRVPAAPAGVPSPAAPVS